MGPLCKRVCDLCAEPRVESSNGVNNVEESHSWSFSVGGKYAWRLLFLLSNKYIFSEAGSKWGENNYSLQPHLRLLLSGDPCDRLLAGLSPSAPPPAAVSLWPPCIRMGEDYSSFQISPYFVLITKAMYVHYLKTRKYEQKRSV